jgi:hypothetical protein
MVEQTHVVENLLGRLSQQLAQAQTSEQHDHLGKAALTSQRAANILDHVNDERLQDKMQSVKSNQQLLDHVHISPEAQHLYDKRGEIQQLPTEKVHGHKQDEEPEIPLPEPEFPVQALEPMELEG